jgi:hypothetical protein
VEPRHQPQFDGFPVSFRGPGNLFRFESIQARSNGPWETAPETQSRHELPPEPSWVGPFCRWDSPSSPGSPPWAPSLGRDRSRQPGSAAPRSTSIGMGIRIWCGRTGCSRQRTFLHWAATSLDSTNGTTVTSAETIAPSVSAWCFRSSRRAGLLKEGCPRQGATSPGKSGSIGRCSLWWRRRPRSIPGTPIRGGRRLRG